jgi:hypothetical protein
MTRDPRRPSRLEPIDDAAIEELVRDVASGWTMPAVRLDAPSWRDRVRSPGARRVDAVRGWLLRVGQAATAAVVLTVVGALVAVMLVRGPDTPGSTPGPTDGGPAPGPSSTAFTPRDTLIIKGDVPNPSTVLVELEQGNFGLVDLETGGRTPVPTGAAYGSVVQWRADGTLLCVCVKVGSMANTQPTAAEITIDRFQADGTLTSSFPAANLVGEPDPRDGTLAERPPHVTFDLQVSEGGRFAIIGWSVRQHPVWQSGITIVDLADGREVSRIALPDSPSGEGDTRRVVWAPRLLSSGADGSVAIAREWYSWSPPTSQGGDYRQDTDVFRADLAGGVLSNPEPLLGAAGCGERVIRAGSTSAGSWIVCARGFSNTLVVRRFDAAGAHAGDNTLAGPVGVDGDLVALSPDGDTLFAWNPVTAQLASIDLATGEQRASAAAATSATPAPLVAIGDWLAPRAAAKSFLQSGIVVSPDGTRVYAAGIVGGEELDGMAGSSGVFVFDAASLTSLGRWEPTADFVSLAVSADGRYVYAAGLARFDASGTQRATQQASITVFAAADGEVQLIAGRLGFDFLTFATPILD